MATRGRGTRSPIVERAVLDSMLEGVRNGVYHLVLGAGSSAGVTNASGGLPLATELTKLLLAEVDGTPAPASVNLPRAYARAIAARGESQIEGLLRLRYAGCTPTSWQIECAKLPWQAIWTLNIDDSVEYAYQAASDRAQRAIVRLWRDPPTPLGGRTDEVPVVHLHGYVGDIDSRADIASGYQLVFSLEHYLTALRTSDLGNWQTRFRGEYPAAPVIVVGARLHDELDLAGVIQAGNTSAEFGLPSIVVRPNISDFEAAEYRDWGLVPVSATAEEIFELLVAALASRDGAVRDGPYSTRYTRATFLELTGRKSDFSAPPRHDFYGGHEPQWQDILQNLDAVPRWVTDLTSEIGLPAEFPTLQRLYYLHGSPFSGKSAGLMRVARELSRNGWRPVHLIGSEKLDVEEALKYFADRPSACLIVDNLRPDVYEVSSLLHRAEAARQRMVIIAADRSSAAFHTRRVVSPKYVIGFDHRVFIEPTSGLWTAIMAKRLRAGRLGVLEGAPRGGWTLHFTQHKGDLFSSLASLEDAAGFVDRGVGVLATLEPNLRAAFAGIGIFAAVGLVAPVAAVAASSGLSVTRLVAAVRPGGELAEWVTFDRDEPGFVRLRHGYLGELMLRAEVRALHRVDLAEQTQELLIAISDRVGFEGIRRKDFYYRAASQLMDLAFVRRMLGSDDVDAWYEVLKTHYYWNARFWEQRALGLTDQLDRAFSYARRAVSTHEDAFTLNTLGTVLMRRAAHPTTDDGARHGYWTDANAALVGSREDGRGRYELPFLTFFGQTLRVRDAAGKLPEAWEHEMRHAVAAWAAEAGRAEIRSDRDLEALIRRFPDDWIDDAALKALERPRPRRRKTGRGATKRAP